MDSLHTLLSYSSPPFIHVHHPHIPSSSVLLTKPDGCVVVKLDLVEYYNHRILLSGILHKLSDALPIAGKLGKRDVVDAANDVGTWDEFTRRLKAIWQSPKVAGASTINGHDGHPEPAVQRLAILLAHGERLRGILGQSMAAMTRIAELVSRSWRLCLHLCSEADAQTGLPVSLILASSIPWDDLRPHQGDALEPIHIYIPPHTKEGLSISLHPRDVQGLSRRSLEEAAKGLSTSSLPSIPRSSSLSHITSHLGHIQPVIPCLNPLATVHDFASLARGAEPTWPTG